MTLSRFLRDYIYIPLGGNRKSELRIYANLFTTFLLGGFWHGAGWTFIFWGVLHGLALMIHRVWKSLGLNMNKYLAWFVTFNFVNVTWIFFRAKEWDDAIKVVKGMLGLSGFGMTSTFTSSATFVAIGCICLFVITCKNSNQLTEIFKPNYKALFFIVFISMLALLEMSKVSEFLYFNF